MKPTIFIGSSSESLPAVKQVKDILEKEFDCVSWNENFFDQNTSTYDNLIKKSICFDYAIFVGGKDDKVFRPSKRTERTGVRDNVYYELGLYSGILSPKRNYFMVHKECTVASDFFGITILPYNDTPASVEERCKELINSIKKEEDNSRPTLLPANTLAYGYYKNFLEPASELLYKTETLYIEGEKYDVKLFPKQLQVVFPENVSANWADEASIYHKEHNLYEILLQGEVKKISVYLDIEVLKKEKKVVVYDIPQTMRASFKCIDMCINDGTFGDTEMQKKVKEKEVRNFSKTLNKLILSGSYSKKIAEVKCPF